MDTIALTLWQSFLHTTPADEQSALRQCLSSELAEDLSSQPLIKEDIILNYNDLDEDLLSVHHSWLAPFLRTLPENEIKLFVASLALEQIEGLKRTLLLSNGLPSPSTLGTSYLRKVLLDTIATEPLTPLCLLPEDPLNELLSLTKEELNAVVDLLCMHDLAIEIRQIIDTAKLKEIYALLTKGQTSFLKTLIHKKEPVSFKRMGLTTWQGDSDSLKSMLLQRGLNRLGKALYGKHRSLLWHVAHRFDSEKGQTLMKLCTALDHPQASALLADQVSALFQTLKSHNPPSNP